MRTNRLQWTMLALGGALALSVPASAQWTTGTDINNTNSGNVGVGAPPAPGPTGFKLDVTSAVGGNALRLTRQVLSWGGGQAQASVTVLGKLTGQTFASANGFGPGIFFQAQGTDGTSTVGRLGFVRDSTFGSKLVIRIVNSSFVEVDALTISNNPGPTGGVSSPLPIHANYSSDVAEWATVRGSSDPGTVVVVNKVAVDEVTPSSKRYDTSVAGVISGKPGIVLGQSGADKATVATFGRVKVKVVTSNGPIHTGDLLVTSDREGYAMRSEPIEVAGVEMHRPGTLIGKALEPLESGEGEVLVLLSMQ